MSFILEPRLLFDASVGAVATKPHNQESHTDPAASDGVGRQASGTTDSSAGDNGSGNDHSQSAHHYHHNKPGASDPQATVATRADGATSDPSAAALHVTSDPAASGTPVSTVLFVDPRVANWQELTSSVAASTKVIVIDPNKDGLKQVTRALQHLHGIKEVDFLTYGQSGEIELGASPINDAVLNANAGEIAGWSNSLAANAQIQFWGCDVGAGTAGAAFVNDLHSITGAGIAASTDATGTVALDGNWTLERTVGIVAPHSPFSTTAEAAYDSVLDQPLPTVTFSGVPATVLLGDSFTETVSFSNGDTTNPGYAPYIELFVPDSSASGEAATLASASYLGSAVSFTAITLTTDGHGNVGAIDPNVLNSSGVAQFVTAPAGFKAGDTMYVLTLPFGSFTPGQPKADINLTFNVDSRSNLSDTGGLNIAAVGVFKYGSSATGNVASIRGTSTTLNSATAPDTSAQTASDGLSTASSDVSLLTVTTQVNTYPGESETATGPDFPGSYVITVTPAPATDAATVNHLNNVVFTYTLPSEVQWTGGAIGFTGISGTVDTTHLSTTTPGGYFTVTYSSLASASASASAVASTISVPFYVPETDNGGSQILSDSGGTVGDSHTIDLNPTYSYTASSWTPVSGAFTGTAQDVSGNGNGNDISFVAKSVAIQVTDDIGADGLLPGENVLYTIQFQVSDYFDLENLVINDLLGDGMTLQPGTTPVLTINNNGVQTVIDLGAVADAMTTVNGQTVATDGSGSYGSGTPVTSWSYVRNNTSSDVANANVDVGTLAAGSTALQFNVGTVMQKALGTDTLTGGTGGGSGGTAGTTGTITFHATVLQKYTETNGLQSVREGDSVTDSIQQGTTGGGTIVSHETGLTKSQYDGSSVTNAEATGTMVLAIDQIADADGTLISSTDFDFQAGDLVTYTLDYTLTAGDYGDLNLNAFLPLPVFNVPTGSNPLTAGDGLALNTYKVTVLPTGASDPTVSTDGTNNSISFNFGTFDSTNNAAGQHVTVKFTVQASSNPFVNGLLLTTQGQSKFTPYDASPTTVAVAAAIQQQHILEPELSIKTGVVSVVDDLGAAKSVTYTGDTGSSNANPTGTFDPAGSATGTSGDVFVSGIPATIGNVDNQNVSGVDGGDTVRVVEVVQNNGGGNAYNVVVNGTLPSGYTSGDVSNFQITRGDGTVLSYTGTLANFFSGTGITIKGGDGTAATPVLTAKGNASDILYVTYDLALAATAAPGQTLTPSGAIVNWSSANGATGFVTNGGTAGASAVGVSSTDLSDTATITASSAAFTKTITAADDSSNVTLDNVVVGETLTYTFTLTLPEGEMTSVNFSDTLPSFLDASTATLSSAPALSSGVTSDVSGGVGSALHIDTTTGAITGNFGNITNANHDATGTLTFSIQVKVANSTNVDGSTITNQGQITSGDSPTLTSSVTATEKDPHITETLTRSTGSSAVYSGEAVTYTLTLTNNGDAPAQDLVDTISLPSGMTWVGGSLTETSGSTTGVTLDDSGHTISISKLAAGTTATFTFQATVNDNLAANTPLTVSTPATYTSMPGVVTGERSYNATGSATVSTGVFTPVLQIVDQSNGTTATDGGTAPSQGAPTTSADATIGEIVRMRVYVQVPEGSNATDIEVALPTGLEFLNDSGATTVGFYSPDGSISSSNSAVNGTSGLQHTIDGTFNPATAGNPASALDSSAISVSSNVVSFDLGTLTNNAHSATANYVMVEFNALVKNVSGNQDGTALKSEVAVNATPTGSSPSAKVTVKEPHITIAKTVESIDQATGVVTWQVTLTNNGDTTAYNVSLDDAESGSSNESAIAGLTTSGNAANLNIASGNATSTLQATMDLAAGKSETFTYTTTVTDKSAPVPDATAKVTYVSLNENTSFTSSFYGSTYGATGDGTAGSITGERTGSDGVGGTLNDYAATATIGLGTATGNVWNDMGSPLDSANQTADSGADTELSGVTLTGTWTGQSTASTVTTSADGNYSFLLPDTVATTISAPTTSGSETLVYDTSNSSTFHHNENGLGSSNAQISVQPSSASQVTGIDFAYRLPDTAPVISTWGNTTPGSAATYTMGGGAITLSGGSTGVADTQLDTLVNDGLGDYSGAVLTIVRHGGANANDVFDGNGSVASGLYLNAGTVNFDGAQVGTYTESGGTLTVTFGTATSAHDVQSVLNNITYSNSGSASQLASGIVIDATLTDHNTQTGSTAGNAFQGTGGIMTSAVAQVLIDIAPAAASAAYQEPNDTAASGNAVALNPSLTLTNSATFSQVVLTVSGNYQSAEDVLAFVGTASTTGSITSYAGESATMGNIAASFDSSTGQLTLTSSGNTATTAQWQAALQAVKYYDSSNTPNTATRTVSISASSTGGETISGTLANVTVASANDSPILDTGVSVSLPHSTEDVSGAPSGAVGALVSTLVGNGTSPSNVTDPDGTALGIAITSLNTAEGNWWYSTDNGAHWTEVTSTVSSSNALHLLADANTRLYFQPTVANWNGTVANAATFRAWDQFDGVSNGALSDIGSTGFGTGINTPASAYSSAADTLSLVVDAVNDAPVASGSSTLTTVAEDTTTPTGNTVSNLFSGNFSDTADQQHDATTNPDGSAANTLAGIAIIGNGSTSTQGTWEYSTDGGSHWTAISTSLTDSSALVLSATAKLAFVPAANYNGTVGSLTVRLIDSSTDVSIAGVGTGLALQSAGAAYTGIDVSGVHDGGITAVSAATVQLNTAVSAVNDAPVASGSSTLTTVAEDPTATTGDTVSNLFSGNFNDSTDQQHDGTTNPDGSTANTLAGIAIVGDAATAQQGTWKYSVDGGTTWTAISTSVSDSSALVLSATAKLAFVPAANYNGTVGSLTVRLIDSSTDVTISGVGTGSALQSTSVAFTGIDVSGVHDGGITAVSLTTVQLNVTVSAVNDAPVASGTATLGSVSEDTTSPSGDTVSDLFSGNFSDSTDQQHDATTNPTGSTANGLAGIAIIGDAATANQGVWKYSTDGGATWTAISTSVSGTSAIVLPQSAKLEFVPAANFNGTPGGLTVRLIDTSTDVSITGVGTGLALHDASTAYTGIDVSGIRDGGITAVSAGTVQLDTAVTAVNDAPIASGGATLVTGGTGVDSLFDSSFSDTADQQRGINSTDGSDANSLAGVAITGNAANSSTQGVWQYSLDGGTTWNTISTGVSDSSALILPNTAKIQFVGVAGYYGTPGDLTVRLIDSSTQTVTTGVTGATLQGGHTAYSNVDVSTADNDNGGTTAVSAASLSLETVIGSTSTTATYTEPNDTSASGAAVAVNDTIILNSGTYSTATLQITGNYRSGEDVLVFTNPGDGSMGNISIQSDAGGTLVLESAGNTATAAQWQTALRAVQYYDSSDTPNATARTITSTIKNSAGDNLSLGTSTMNVVSVDDSPILDTGVTVSLPNGTEDVSGAPVDGSTTGSFLLSSIDGIGGGTAGNVADPDGPSTGAGTAGVLITHADTEVGNWWCSTDGGAHWTEFASNSMTAVSSSNALQLIANANTRLYFQPTIANWNGTITNALTFRAWDQFNSASPSTPITSNGNFVDVSGVAAFGQNAANNTAGSAYSIGQDVLSLTVDPVNDAPVAAGVATLPSITENGSPAQKTVAHLFGPDFNDSADQVNNNGSTLTGGTSANGLAGIAITGDLAKAATEGSWKYSTDGGVTWTAIVPGTLSDSHALVLSASALIEFVPVSGFSGTPGGLTVRLIDNSTQTTLTGVGTGLQLQSSTTAFTDIDVSADGTPTAVSSGTIPLTTSIDPLPPSNFLPNLDPINQPSPSELIFGQGAGNYVYMYSGGREPDWLVGSDVFRVLEAGIPGTANVSADVFYGSSPRQNLQFDAMSIDGGPLPPWLSFDPSLLRFNGTPPANLEGSVDVKVVATDRNGRQATAEVHIVIAREPADLLALLHPIASPSEQAVAPDGAHKPAPSDQPIVPPAPPANDQSAPAGDQPSVPPGDPPASGTPSGAPHNDNTPPPSQGAIPKGIFVPGPGRTIQGFGLSPQLRDQTQAGRLARARMLLNALSAGPASL